MSYTLEEAFRLAEVPRYAEKIIRSCYSQEHRIYHNLEHIERMCFAAPKDYLGIEGVLEAILFHDIVKLNFVAPVGLEEALSIAEYISYSKDTLGFRKSPFCLFTDDEKSRPLDRERLVVEAINATAYHLCDQRHLSLSSKLLLDLDLFSLASPEDEYAKINQSIHNEYLQFCTEAEWLNGRLLFIKKMLERERIYYLQTQWEEAARRNLKAELDTLTAL